VIAILLAALAIGGPPLPDHPVTHQPVTPTWTYTYTRSGAGWTARCWQPPHGHRNCTLTITFNP
jgi:hypothetical protein